MAAEPSQQPIERDADPPTSEGPPARRRWRWLAAAVVACAALGGVVLERLTRPADSPVTSEGGGAPPSPIRAGAKPALEVGGDHPPADLPSSLPTTLEGWIAEGRSVGDRLLESWPDSPDALALAGRVYHTLGDAAKASECWEKSLRISPDFAEAWLASGGAAWRRGDFPEAAARLGRAFALDVELRPTELIFLADSLINVGKPREAVAVLEKTAKIKALPVRGTLLLGHGYMQLQENQKAKEHFEVALAVDPNLASAHYGMATVLARLGDSQQALKHRQLYAKLKTQDLAEVDRRHGVERDTDMGDLRPVVAEIYVNAGKVFASHGKPAQAQAHWRKAAAMDPQNPDPRKLLEMSTTK